MLTLIFDLACINKYLCCMNKLIVRSSTDTTIAILSFLIFNIISAEVYIKYSDNFNMLPLILRDVRLHIGINAIFSLMYGIFSFILFNEFRTYFKVMSLLSFLLSVSLNLAFIISGILDLFYLVKFQNITLKLKI